LLARTLGRTLSELHETMSVTEYLMWRDEYARAPWGEERADLQAAVISQTVANFAGRSIKGDEGAKLSEFILDFSGSKEPDVEIDPDPMEHFKQFMT
jgi:hypothetical protein